MKKNVWAKTVLTSYRYLERICGAIDKLVENRALASFYFSKAGWANSDTMQVADKIIDLSERKKSLINYKIIIERALEKLNPRLSQFLIERYIDNENPEIIAEHCNVSTRGFFRNINKAERCFEGQLDAIGYGQEKMQSMLQKEKWIKQIYSQYAAEDEQKKKKESEIE